MLNVKNLKVNAGEKPILNGVDLSVENGETIILMGRNGSGKSTLAGAIMHAPNLTIAGGLVEFNGVDLATLKTEEIARQGIFLGQQNTPSISGLTISTLLKHSTNSLRRARGESELSAPEFFKLCDEYCALLELPKSFLAREVGVGFSGGEKKRIQCLEMMFAAPKLAILDEPDSGVDVSSIDIIARAIMSLQLRGVAFLVISHYPRLISAIKPNRVCVMGGGKVVRVGDINLANEIEKVGFDE